MPGSCAWDGNQDFMYVRQALPTEQHPILHPGFYVMYVCVFYVMYVCVLYVMYVCVLCVMCLFNVMYVCMVYMSCVCFMCHVGGVLAPVPATVSAWKSDSSLKVWVSAITTGLVTGAFSH